SHLARPSTRRDQRFSSRKCPPRARWLASWVRDLNMQIFRSMSELQPDFGPTVLSVGNFDGVHRAHQKVIATLLKRAQELHARSLIVTFDPHPTRVLRPDLAPKLITPLSKKLELLSSFAVDAALVIPFTREFSKT